MLRFSGILRIKKGKEEIDMEYFYSAVFCSDLEVAKNSVEKVVEELTDIVGCPEVALETRVILNELLTNGILHGNHCCREKCIKLSVEIIDEEIVITVKDEGDGFYTEDAIKESDELCSSGRGLTIVEKLTDSFVVDRNTIRVKKVLKDFGIQKERN